MTPDLEALARRAVACPRWRWMPGVLRLRDAPGKADHGQREGRVEARDGWPYAEWPCLPDLTDPATLGCLLALVREVYGSPALYCRLSSTTRASDGIRAWEVIGWLDASRSPNGRGGSFLGWGYASEAEALVATLEAAP